MEDALDLVVEDNEFASESQQKRERQSSDLRPDTKPKLSPSFDPNDYISLSEAKKKLLESLEEYELKGDVMMCSRGSVKSRLGSRQEGVEYMDCSESNDVDDGKERLFGSQGRSDDTQSKNTTFRHYDRLDDIPRRPCLKNLCRRLRARWYDNPVKIGKELAERLEEHKFSLIINTVKIIGGKRAIELFNETKRIQLEGGMKTCNGSRRRTSGGVFLTLLKSSNYATAEQVKEIFQEDNIMRTEALKRKKKLYQQRKRARDQLQKQAVGNTPSNTEQMDRNTTQLESDTTNTEQTDTNTNPTDPNSTPQQSICGKLET